MAVIRRLLGSLTLPPPVRKFLGGLVVAVIVATLILLGVIEPFELDALDRLFLLRGPRPTTAPIVIVNVDEDSFDELGPLASTKTLVWPFPRAMHGMLLDAIASGGPRVIGVDILFSTPSQQGAADDQEFAEAVARAKKVVLGAAITVVSEDFYVKRDENFPIPIIREGAAAVAPVNPTLDDDNVVRRMPLRRVASQTLDGFDVTLYRLAAASGLPVAPLPRRNDFIINYRGPMRSFPWVPYHRVIKGDVDPKMFKDKIVLVGTTSVLLHDNFATPFERSGQMPGVEIHAHAIDTLVRGDRIRPAPVWLSVVLAVLFAPLGAWLVVRLRALRAFAALVGVWLAVVFVTYLLFSSQIWVRQVGPALALLFGYVATSIEHFIREQREKRRLSQFFSPDVLREIVRHGEGVNLGSARHLITVFFSDLRGFTSLSEKMEPEVVAEMLKEYLTDMTEVVFRHKGTVDKYIGDCVMAIWNAPFEDPDHAINAVRTALDFQEKTLEVSAKWEGGSAARSRTASASTRVRRSWARWARASASSTRPSATP